VILEGLKRWGADRGRILRREHEEQGIEVDLANFITHHDLPIRFAWDIQQIEMHPRHVIIEIRDSPHDDAWKDLGVDGLAADWYEGSYPAMVDAYLPGSKASWTSLRGRGGAVNRLELTARS
jgi:hypothetical protein